MWNHPGGKRKLIGESDVSDSQNAKTFSLERMKAALSALRNRILEQQMSIDVDIFVQSIAWITQPSPSWFKAKNDGSKQIVKHLESSQNSLGLNRPVNR